MPENNHFITCDYVLSWLSNPTARELKKCPEEKSKLPNSLISKWAPSKLFLISRDFRSCETMDYMMMMFLHLEFKEKVSGAKNHQNILENPGFIETVH